MSVVPGGIETVLWTQLIAVFCRNCDSLVHLGQRFTCLVQRLRSVDQKIVVVHSTNVQ